jgi:hypothetical protein
MIRPKITAGYWLAKNPSAIDTGLGQRLFQSLHADPA